MTAPPRRTRTEKLAETLFVRSCDVAGGACNPSIDDQYGWDFIFQLPATSDTGPPDLARPGLTGLAQVKSTRGTQAKVTLKVSNALRMAQEATPCFVVLMAFTDEAAEPHTAWVLHIWTAQIAQALEAARRAHLAGTALHKSRVTLTFPDTARCDPLQIAARIEAEVAAIGPDYAAQKAKIRDTVGYEDGYGGGAITFDAADEDKVIDMLLGRVADLPVLKVDLREERFGLPGPPMTRDQPSRIGIEAKPFERCQLVLCRGHEELTLQGDVYVPNVPNLSRALFKVRFQTRFLEVIWRQEGPSEVNAKFSIREAYPIEALAELVTMMAWMAAGDVEMAIWTDRGQFTRGPLSLDASNLDPPSWEALRMALERILQVLPSARWPRNATFCLNDLMEGLEGIDAFASRVAAPAIRVNLSGAPAETAPLLPQVEHHLAPAFLQLDGVTLYAFVLAPVTGHIHADDDKLFLDLGSPKLLQRGALSGSVADNWVFLHEAYEAARQPHVSLTILQGLLPTTPDAATAAYGAPLAALD